MQKKHNGEQREKTQPENDSSFATKNHPKHKEQNLIKNIT
jgi:hypothetical protein